VQGKTHSFPISTPYFASNFSFFFNYIVMPHPHHSWYISPHSKWEGTDTMVPTATTGRSNHCKHMERTHLFPFYNAFWQLFFCFSITLSCPVHAAFDILTCIHSQKAPTPMSWPQQQARATTTRERTHPFHTGHNGEHKCMVRNPFLVCFYMTVPLLIFFFFWNKVLCTHPCHSWFLWAQIQPRSITPIASKIGSGKHDHMVRTPSIDHVHITCCWLFLVNAKTWSKMPYSPNDPTKNKLIQSSK
jgi:hypothetical protein